MDPLHKDGFNFFLFFFLFLIFNISVKCCLYHFYTEIFVHYLKRFFNPRINKAIIIIITIIIGSDVAGVVKSLLFCRIKELLLSEKLFWLLNILPLGNRQ